MRVLKSMLVGGFKFFNKVDMSQYDLLNIWCVPDQFKTQETCNRAVQSKPWVLKFLPDQFKTQEMCNRAVQSKPEVLEYVPDWFVAPQEMEEFDDELVTWRDAYIKRKTQKAQIKEELMPVAWHPDRWWDLCVPEDEKQELEIYFS